MSEAAIRAAVQRMLEPSEAVERDWDDVLARASRPEVRVRRVRSRRRPPRRLALSLALLLGAVLVATATPAGTAIARAVSALVGWSAPQEYQLLQRTPFPRSRLPEGVTMPAKPTAAPSGDGHWDVGWNLRGHRIGYGGGVLDYYLRATDAVARKSFEHERARISKESGARSTKTPWPSVYPTWTVERALPAAYGALIRQRCGKTAKHCSALYSETLVGDVQIVVITGFRSTSQVQVAHRVTQAAVAFLHSVTTKKG